MATTPLTFIECPYCGKQDMMKVGDGTIIHLFAMELLDRNFKEALKGLYHTWTCIRCGNKFIRSNVLCTCMGFGKDKGIIIKSEKPKPIFLCSKCKTETEKAKP